MKTEVMQPLQPYNSHIGNKLMYYRKKSIFLTVSQILFPALEAYDIIKEITHACIVEWEALE